jgi:hypothetical protein
VYTEYDPRIIEPQIPPPPRDGIAPKLSFQEDVTESNVYDPRYEGYGTSYRAYTDKKLGQTKFMYDDVNAIRMPNYITRSNIDHQPFADSYGPMRDEFGNENTANIRAMANDAYLRDNIKHREDIQESVLRKFGSRYSQLRAAPISTMNRGRSGVGRR